LSAIAAEKRTLSFVDERFFASAGTAISGSNRNSRRISAGGPQMRGFMVEQETSVGTTGSAAGPGQLTIGVNHSILWFAAHSPILI
jgi:hypothetical protein